MVRLEGGGEDLGRIDAQAGEQLGVRPGDPGRGALQTVAVRVLTDGDEDLPDRFLDAGQVDGLLDRGAGELAVDQTRGEVVQGLLALSDSQCRLSPFGFGAALEPPPTAI